MGSLVTGCAIYYQKNIGIYNKWIKQLDDDIHSRRRKDPQFDQIVVAQIKEKQHKGKILSEIEQFVMGYHAYYSGDYEGARDYYDAISKCEIKDKRQLVNVLLLQHMNRIYSALEKNDKALELTAYCLEHLPNKAYKLQGGLVIYSVSELGKVHGNNDFIN